MTTRSQPDSEDSIGGFGWTNRTLVLAIAGILLLTLYPFRFVFNRHLPAVASPLFLGGWGKPSGLLDVFLNVLLFVPFGFGLAGIIRERGKSPIATLALAFAAGALFSYSIEFLQFFIPDRDSGWEDVITNSTGALLGCLTFQYCGLAVFRLLNNWERVIDGFATLRNTTIVLLVYFGVWFAFSARLQKETALSNWNSDALLVVGNSTGRESASAWNGEVYQLEFWDRALPGEAARRLTSADTAGLVAASAFAAYDFSGSPPFEDARHVLPDLSWVRNVPESIHSNGATFDGDSWLSSRGPVSKLVEDFRNARQFAVRIVCQPGEGQGADARIVSISSASGPVNLELWQKDSDLVFWFRSPLSIQRSRMSWVIRDVFAPNEPRDILFSYDGSNLSLFIDGQKHRRTYVLGPGAALATAIRRIKTAELQGYEYVFYALVFAPAGCLLGCRWRKMPAQPFGRFLLVMLGFVLPAVLFEIILVRVGGQGISPGNVALAISMVCLGSLWVNLGGVLKAPAGSNPQASAK